MFINRLVNYMISKENFELKAQRDIEGMLTPSGKKMAMRFARGNVAVQEGAYVTREQIAKLPRLKR